MSRGFLQQQLLIFLMPLLLLFSTALHAQELRYPEEGTPVVDVEIEGLRYVDESEITRVLQLQPGEIFTYEALRQDQQAIANTGMVDPLSIRLEWTETAEGVSLTYKVKENPVIRDIEVFGNLRYSQEQLLAQLDYKPGDLMPTGVAGRTRDNLRRFYSDAGYKNTGITVEIVPVEEAEAPLVDIRIIVDEKERIKIKDLKIKGADHFNNLLLKARLLSTGSWLFFNNYYDERDFQTDMKLIEDLYREEGFLDAETRRGEFEFNREDAWVSPVIQVEEGPRYRVESVLISGVTLFTSEEVQPLFRPLEGEYFDGNSFQDRVAGLQTLYGEQGYIDAQISTDYRKDPGEQTVDLIVQVEENEAVYVGDIYVDRKEYDYEIEGAFLDKFLNELAPPVKEETIRKEVRLEKGKKYRTNDEIRTVQRLRNLGIFEKVNVRRESTGDPQVRNAVVEVEEDPAAAYLGVTAGVGDQSGPAVTFSFVQPNVGGRADRLSLAASFGTRITSFRIGYLDRYIQETKTSWSVAAYRTTEEFREYDERTYGLDNEFGRPLSEYVRGELRFRLAHVDFRDTPDESEEDFDNYFVASVRPMVVKDRRDNIFWPTRDYLVSGGVEIGYADGFLLKFLHAYERYWTLTDDERNIYAYAHTVGLMPYEATDIGLSERFFAGGTSTLRGFRPRGIGPVDDEEDDLHIGGSTRITQRHELRHSFSKVFKGRIFVDGAILEEDFLELGTPRIGTGIGVIVDMKSIMIEADLAAPVVMESDDEAQFLHLRLSSKF